MRKKKNLEPRLAACAAWQAEAPEAHRGAWRALFGAPAAARLELEIGCGKGSFITETARQNPDVFYLAVERVPSVLLLALEKAKALGLPNLRLMDCDAGSLGAVFAPGEIDRLYLNFSDPWPPKKQHKRRLTYYTFLRIYEGFLKPDAEICFKTDNRRLFEDSLCYFSQSGWGLYDVTFDLHATDTPNVETEYERNFSAQGYPIYRCVARRNCPEPSAAEQ